MKKLEISNEEKNVLLVSKEGYQNVERYSSIIGELYCYYYGESKMFYLDSRELGDVKSIVHLSNSTYLLHLNNGTVLILELKKMKMLFYESFETLHRGYYLVGTGREVKRILRLEGMEESEGFKSYEDLGNGTFLITHIVGDRRFLRIDEKNGIQESNWFDLESYEPLGKDCFLLNCKYKRRKFINISNMTETDYLGFISYEHLENGLYLLTYDESKVYKKLLNSENMLVSDELYFEYHKDLGNGLLHLFNSSPNDSETFEKFLRIEDMKIPSLFLSYIDMGNGFYLLTDEGDEKIFLRVEDLKESEPLMFKICSPEFLCTSIYGSTAKFDIETMTMGPWSFI
jgi:hypothetical protein